jgi:imidazolonepropionase-like amidohydrolase
MGVVFQNANVVDVVNRVVQAQTSVRVADGVIVSVGADVVAESNDEVVDCRAGYLLPGLTDVHVHIQSTPHLGPSTAVPVPGREAVSPSEQARAEVLSRLAGYLYCGVTSVFDAGNNEELIFGLRDDERAGLIASPRIFCTGPFVTCTGGHGSTFGSCTEVNSLPADGPRLQAHLARRPDILKITYDEHNWGVRPLIPVLSPEVLAGIIRYAHEARTRVTVHVSNELRAREAIAAGADTLAHPVIQSPVTDEFVWQLAARKIPVASTLAIGERYFRLADRPEFLDGPLYTACLSADEREDLRTREHEAQRHNRWADWMRVMTPIAQENLRTLIANGGIVATGSDLSLGPDLHREMELLQAGGVPAWDVLRSATLQAAAFLGKEASMGSIRPGNVADILIVDQDPTTDVSNLNAISMVMKAGALIDRSALPLPGTAE